MSRQPIARAASFDFDVKRAADGTGASILSGKLAVFDDWTEIKSPVERPSHFMERIARGAFSKTIREQGDRMKVLFQHGTDPSVGKKPLGTIQRLEENDGAVEYDVALFNTDYVDALIPGLEAGVYGSSFLATPIQSKTEGRVQRSDYNPERLPEVTHLELKMHEFGPVTFPAYPEADARMRSVTEEFMLPGLRELAVIIRNLDGAAALTETTEPEPPPPDGDETTPEVVSRSTQTEDDNKTEEVKPSWYLE